MVDEIPRDVKLKSLNELKTFLKEKFENALPAEDIKVTKVILFYDLDKYLKIEKTRNEFI